MVLVPSIYLSLLMYQTLNLMQWCLNFAYLCDVSYDNDEHLVEPYMSIFNIHSINAKPVNMSMEKNSCMLCIPKDITPRTMMMKWRK